MIRRRTANTARPGSPPFIQFINFTITIIINTIKPYFRQIINAFINAFVNHTIIIIINSVSILFANFIIGNTPKNYTIFQGVTMEGIASCSCNHIFCNYW